MNSLFGMSLPQPYLYVLAFAGILVLVSVVAYVLRGIVRSSRGFEGSGRSRQPRLGIVDTFSVDRQRQLMIVRRDNVEHLVLIGGNSDLVIETNIVRANMASVRESPPPPKMPQNTAGFQAPSVAMPTAQDPTPKVPMPPFIATNTQPTRVRSGETDIRPTDFAEIARHFERPTEANRFDASHVSDRTLLPIAHDPFAATSGTEAPLTATQGTVIVPPRANDDHETHQESDPLSAPIIPTRNDMSPTEGLRRLLGRNGETS